VVRCSVATQADPPAFRVPRSDELLHEDIWRVGQQIRYHAIRAEEWDVVVDVSGQMATAMRLLGDVDGQDRLLRGLLDMVPPTHRAYPEVLIWLAELEASYESAKKMLLEAERLLQSTERRHDLEHARMRLGIVELLYGRYEDATSWFDLVVHSLDRDDPDDQVRYAQLLDEIGMAEHAQGLYAQAELRYEEARNVFVSRGLRHDEYICLRALLRTLAAQQRWADAAAAGEDAIGIAVSLGLLDDVPELHFDVASSYVRLEDFEPAEAHDVAALEYAASLDVQDTALSLLAQVHLQLAGLLAKRGAFHSALDHATQATELAVQHPEIRPYAQSWVDALIAHLARSDSG
jgi:tetratricopeptide (TPR) repeat protein